MKTLSLITGLLITSVSFADIDYTRCNQAGLFGATIDNDGQIKPYDFLELQGKTTTGNEETYTFAYKSNYGIVGAQSAPRMILTVTRDENGKVVKVQSGGDKPDQQTIDMWKNMYQGGGTVGGYGSGSGYGGGFVAGGIAGGFSEPYYNIDGKSVSLDKMTSEEAKSAGFGSAVDDYRKLSSQRRKDKKTLEAMKKAYKKIHDKADYVFPFGQESEFEIKDGVCMLKSMSNRQYSTKTKEVTTQLISSRQGCEEVQKLYKKYEPRLNECQSVSNSLNKEYWENFGSKHQLSPWGGSVGGIAGGYAGGFGGSYVNGGGMAGGYPTSGIVIGGGYAGGFNSSPYVGPISGELWSCEQFYGVGRIEGGVVGGSQSGATAGSKQ